jgi:hypothetical protein
VQYIEGPRAQLTDARLFAFETRLRAAEDLHAELSNGASLSLARLSRVIEEMSSDAAGQRHRMGLLESALRSVAEGGHDATTVFPRGH